MYFPQDEIKRRLSAAKEAGAYEATYGYPVDDLEIKLLEKQIQVAAAPGGYCPVCGYKLFLQLQNYCGHCGQAIRRAK